MIDIINDDCNNYMNKTNLKFDCILTSPPYNMTKRKGGYADKFNRYDVYNDWKTEDEYIDFMITTFSNFEKVLNKKGVILLNLSYSIENPSLPYKLIVDIINKTKFNLIDTIIWKKSNGVPFPANKYRLSRIVEFIFVFTFKGQENDYNNNRKVKSVNNRGQKYYEISYNFIEAKNNDGKCEYNQATYSSELCIKLLNIYAKKDGIVFDPFNGTGTTGVACKKIGIDYVGTEISKKQCDYSIERINNTIV